MAGEHEERTCCDREERDEQDTYPFSGHVTVRTPVRALRFFMIISAGIATQALHLRAATMAAEVKLSSDMEEKGEGEAIRNGGGGNSDAER